MRSLGLLGLLGFASIAAACASPRTSGSTVTTGSTTAPPPSTPPETGWEIHEWGLVDVIATTGVAEIAAGPGRPGGPSGRPPMVPDHPMSTRKPVLYVHLGSALPALTFRAEVTLPSGRAVEHWPTGTLTANGVVWNEVRASRGGCDLEAMARGRRDEPARRAVPVCATPDGYCEVDDLHAYVTSDADCLNVAGASAQLLFYRGASSPQSLPLRASRDGNGRVAMTTTTPSDGTPSSVYRVGTGYSGPLATRELRGLSAPTVYARRARMPAPGATATLEIPSEVADVVALRAALGADLSALGMTSEEARTFLDAWMAELFVSPHAGDVILYWLPRAAIDDIARLSFEPSPSAVRRAMLVRLDLGAVATAGPSGLGGPP